MHDPMTVAFEIKHPFFPRRFGKHLLWPSLITVWHVDPERDGSDDSCGWGRVRLTVDQKGQLDWLAGCEARAPWLLREAAKEPASPCDAEALMRGALLAVARQLRQRMSLAEATEVAVSLIHSPHDNVRSHLCLLPGYHTNATDDDPWYRERNAKELFRMVGTIILSRRRPWWRHPRWHFWHWKIQVHLVQAFKRWAWSRCERCGGRFRWGESPVSSQWDSPGPRWFKGEKHVAHCDCSNPGAGPAMTEGRADG